MEKSNCYKNKTVGVITMHRVINYGSFLQAYATQTIIEDLGYKCDIIDYVFPNQWHFDKKINSQNIIKKTLANIIHKTGIKASYRKKIKVENAIEKYLNLSNKYNTPHDISNNPPKYDIYITGSDQTWNPKHTKGDNTFLLDFTPESSKRVSFSASLAGKNMDDNYKSDFKKYLKRYDHIAIRDSNGNCIINELLGEDAVVTLDPTLLLNKNKWTNFYKNRPDKYKEKSHIVFYLITHSFDVTPYIYDLLKELQDKTGLNVYSFTEIPVEYNIKYKKCSDIGVEDFIELIMKSSYVVTSSFHGTAFAVNFGVPLYSVIDKINNSDDRQSSLLKKLNIEQCLVPVGKKFKDINPNYNERDSQERLELLRKDSIDYLRTSLLD
ncbi:polysaccharide pyruvyl transferase family protein [Photobacterium damselae]|uniref:polysaccharide pyruvyl transferase family protein n=1 Tax=Photobacterium damselae TaxID=38293 RepID=UPI0012489247|nr:polysaccharide pyruvyl transferase family protein [Photobacterium damselae]KAB1182948.1 polysaccharide pyruvyl transferase family protein [Photobacterium damselae subsp. damselae]MBF7101599.1 polysaccharide pyruvyl transferase family protein [Photobacterium damselae]